MTFRALSTRSLSTLLAVAALAYAGCGARDEAAEAIDESSDALKFHAQELDGAYNLAPGFTADFTHLVLKSDGTFFSEQEIVCVRAPCINPRLHGTWSSSHFSPTDGTGNLTLKPVGHAKMRYVVSLAGDGSGMKLAHHANESAAQFDRVPTFCDTVSDCAGQPVPPIRVMCMIGQTVQTFCTEDTHACVAKCAPTPECTVDADCRLFDDYCTGCDCRALSRSAADPVCTGPGVRCFAEPCQGHVAQCVAGTCTVR